MKKSTKKKRGPRIVVEVELLEIMNENARLRVVLRDGADRIADQEEATLFPGLVFVKPFRLEKS